MRPNGRSAPCGLCDRCVATSPARVAATDDEAAGARALLAAVSRCQGRFGVTSYRRVVAREPVESPTGVRCRGLSGVWRVSGLVEAALTRLAKALIDRGYLCVEGGDYPTLDVTTRGQEVLEGIRSRGLEPG